MPASTRRSALSVGDVYPADALGRPIATPRPSGPRYAFHRFRVASADVLPFAGHRAAGTPAGPKRFRRQEYGLNPSPTSGVGQA
jgi:hypothetical protein